MGSDVPGKKCVRLAMKVFWPKQVEYFEEHPNNQLSFPLERIIGKNALNSTVVH